MSGASWLKDTVVVNEFLGVNLSELSSFFIDLQKERNSSFSVISQTAASDLLNLHLSFNVAFFI